MHENDATYCGDAVHADLSFNAPSVESDNWVSISSSLQKEMACEICSFDEQNKRKIWKEDDLTNYENPDFLWLSHEIIQLCYWINKSQDRKMPYVQLYLKATADRESAVYPRAHIKNSKYVVEFEQPFFKVYLNFLSKVFDDNPRIIKKTADDITHVEQYMAPIYRQPPFEEYFTTRHDIPGIVFHASVQMLLAHELAHIRNGHLNLSFNSREYATNRDVMLALEDNADMTGLEWMLKTRFFQLNGETVDISLDEYRQELSLSVFSVYLLFTWNYSKENRKWSIDAIRKFCGSTQNHFPYQIRAYNAVTGAQSILISLGKTAEQQRIRCLDGKMITAAFMVDCYNDALKMINAFENAYHMLYAHTQDLYELVLNKNYDALRNLNCELINEKIPAISDYEIPLMMGYEEIAKEEVRRIRAQWPVIMKKLYRFGTYGQLN